MLKIGDRMPYFEVMDQDGNVVRSAELLGRKTIIYFYPKDNTSGCTAEACNLRDNYEKFLAKGYNVIGVSKDSVASHAKFAEKHSLPFILLSDPELVAIQGYDVWKEKKLYGKVSMGVVRTTYVIDENGVIEKVMPKVKPDTNAAEILAYLNGEEA
jgi:peroxiredoxin Q/BCP